MGTSRLNSALAAAGALALTGTGAEARTIYGVTTTGALVKFDSATPGKPMKAPKISGLAKGERIAGIDFRPSDKRLYAVTSASRLYTIDTATGKATAIGMLSVPLSGASHGVDFNPVPDRLRITSDAAQNLRTNPADGAVTADKPLAFAAADANAGAKPMIAASGYTNNFAGTKATTLYNIDAGTDALVTQNPPNDGVLNTIGKLGVKVTANAGLDIAGPGDGDGTAFAALQVEGAKGSGLYTIDLAGGAAKLVGKIAGAPLVGIAVSLD